MKIRSITCFIQLDESVPEKDIIQIGQFAQKAKLAFAQEGYEVETTRLATSPFSLLMEQWHVNQVVDYARTLERTATAAGFDYISLGPALPETPTGYAHIPALIERTDNTFASAVIARQSMIYPRAVRAAAEVIHALAPQQENGFANLYFAALANVAAGAPFFPAAYHDDTAPTFAIATESADLAVTAFEKSASLAESAINLQSAIQENADRITKTAYLLAQEAGIIFGGIDFSLAPYPETSRSLGTAMERLGIPAVGMQGSLLAATLLTSAIDKARFKRAGFSGLMLPVLEDSTLAQRAKEGRLSITDLLLYSAVCGTGLDTIPLASNVSIGQIEAILWDLAALAVRLNKPLTARLMPIPGKSAGDPTDFAFDYFANSTVMPIMAEALNLRTDDDEPIHIATRSSST